MAGGCGDGGVIPAILNASTDGRGGRTGFIIFQFFNGSEDGCFVRHGNEWWVEVEIFLDLGRQ